MAAVDTLVTVKQHGFVVKEGPSKYVPPHRASSSDTPSYSTDTSIFEDGFNSSGLSRKALGLVTPTARQAAPSLPSGLPCSGDLRPAEHAHLSSGVKRLMRSVVRGLKAHQDPEAATEGLGGTYFFRNEAGTKIAIMKPCDEEPLAPNNPKGFVGRKLGEAGLKPTVRVGEAAPREVAAYLLDHDHFARVPHTVMVSMAHPIFHWATPPPESSVDDDELGLARKGGSLQEFVPHECDTSEMGASCYSVKDVQRIAILDIRLFNTDRHAGNILVRKIKPGHAVHASMPRLDGPALADLYLQEQYELIPIDHGFALPEALEPPYFEWQHWPQAMMPFGREELEYIANLDPQSDVEMLRRELPTLREESLRLLQVSTTVLKKCAAAGLSLYEIAGVVTRPLIGLDEEPSELEKLCFATREEVDELHADDFLSDLEEHDEDYNDEDDEEEQPVDEDLGSPSSDGASSGSQFNMSTRPNSGDASRVADDVLFSMDDDATRTPANGSPNVGPKLLTPLATGGLSSYAFSAMSTGVDSLSASFDSAEGGIAIRGRLGDDSAVSSASTTFAVSGGFTGMPATYGAGVLMRGHGTKSQPRPSTKSRRRRLAGARNTRGIRNGGGGVGTKAYPPLVESRSPGAASAIFSDMSPAQWQHFMTILSAKIDAEIRSGAWEQSAQNKGPAPLMSCPRF